jgi:hypothetical protein
MNALKVELCMAERMTADVARETVHPMVVWGGLQECEGEHALAHASVVLLSSQPDTWV